MMRKIFFLLILLIISIKGVYSQNITFKAKSPDAVIVGQQFRLSFTLTNATGTELRLPDLPGFDVLMGPSTSTSNSTQVINGQVSSESSVTYTFILSGKEPGTYEIGPSTIKVKDSQYKSNSLTIKVLPPDKNIPSGGNNNQQNQGDEINGGSSNIGANELFVRMQVSKNSIYENEGFLVTFKLYSLYDVGMENPKFPEFEGFIAQEVELPQAQWSLESYNGRNYRTVVIKQTVLYPQRSGKITIGSGKFDMAVRVKTQQKVRSFFDDFFDTFSTVKKTINSAPVIIDVKPLPTNKPVSFNGAVGDYQMTSSISSQNVKSNESVTIKVNISGSGNVKMIKNPEITFPNDFDIYDPKVDVNTKVSAAGVNGSKTIEYYVIPRYAGDFVIPKAEFSYFDTKTGAYKTLYTDEFKLHVEKGPEGEGANQLVLSNSGVNKEDVKFLGKDIHYIKTKEFEFMQKGNFFFGNLLYILCYVIPTILFIIFFIIYRKQAAENANIALVRTKKANKVASKRLKLAGKFLKENKKEEFYDEVLKALWGYLSDKLNIPVATLTKDNVESELTKYGVSDELIQKFINILNTCEFARYAPSRGTEEMDELYSSTTQAIDKMENTIKK